MALQTPRQRALRKPSNTSLNGNSSPLGNALGASTSKAVNRTASLQALTGEKAARSPSNMAASGGAEQELAVGDGVTVPGDMFGTVKFIGSVRGKQGRFVGVELDESFAGRGKNDGDVDGIHYFHTDVPGAGIFLPVHRAEKRFDLDSFPDTPTPVSPSKARGAAVTPHMPSKFSQSVGPGARPASPNFKPKRPSLPRPESPLRKQPDLRPTPAKGLSQSVRGGRPSGLSSTTPSKSTLKASTTARPSVAGTARPYSRTGSRQGKRGQDEDDRGPIGFAQSTSARHGSNGSVPSFSQPLRSPSRLGSAGGQDAEINKLRNQLQERDRRLDEQAASLAEMERSVAELSALMPAEGLSTPTERGGDKSAAQLRQMLREKNEKISMLTAEFDQHRADFRSTLDSLEMASTETERVYEEQKRDLLQQIAELQEYNHTRQEQDVDVQSVARQLKQLEELVAELEEGLEESRRGEAEARGEVEFLRGEVERGRSELKREREKAAAALKAASGNAPSQKLLEEKDDEIRGLKAIVHNLSSSPPPTENNSNGYVTDSDEYKRVQASFEESQKDKERLEEEIERMRRELANATLNGHVRKDSERTVGRPASPPSSPPNKPLPARPRSGTAKARNSKTNSFSAPFAVKPAQEPQSNGTPPTGVYCEMCESSDHDTLECTNLRRHHSRSPTKQISAESKQTLPQSPPVQVSAGVGEAAPESSAVTAVDEDKWCALCEKDGHLAFDCPEEQY